MQKHLLGYRDNLRVEVEPGIPIVARTVAELRTLSTWPGPLLLEVHIDLDPRFSVMTGSNLVGCHPGYDVRPQACASIFQTPSR